MNPTMEYSGENQFKTKTDEELMKDINLSHLTEEQHALACTMLKQN